MIEKEQFMGNFVLKTELSAGTTSVSNTFLDHYMPKANGEYVKVYLFLLRALHEPSRELSVAALADALDHTESDILRALKYWEKQGLLKLECNACLELQGIYILDIPPVDMPTEQLVVPKQEKTADSVGTSMIFVTEQSISAHSVSL